MQEERTTKNVFVLGADDFNMAQLRKLRHTEQYRFHELFRHAEIKAGAEFPVEWLLEEGARRLREFSGHVDAIVGYWDFPVSTMLPLLRRPFGLPSPTLEATLKCEHKYWCRLEQQRVIPEFIPPFCAVDPFAPNARAQIPLEYPFWIKPVKSASSFLGFMVRNDAELEHAIDEIRRRIFRFAEPFNYLLGFADLPPEVAPIDGKHCIAESIISRGRQCTLEGYVHRGRVRVYGAVDSIREGKHRSSFARYQYPSRLPSCVRKRMIEVTRRFIEHIGYDDAPFNIEFYWDEAADRIALLEVNARISKSHCPLFEKVDGVPHLQVMVDVALGRRPDFPHREGAHRVAGKFMWRVTDDAVVRHVPDADELAAIGRRIDSAQINLHVREGSRLSELPDQDSYSYEIAEIFLGADSQRELLARYRACRKAMHLELERVA